MDDPRKQSVVLRNVICTCKVCDSSTSIAVAECNQTKKTIFNHYLRSERHHTKTRLIFQSFISTVSATIQIHVRFLSPLLSQRAPPHKNVRFLQSIISTASATIQNPFHFSIHYLHSERHHTKTFDFSIHYFHSERHHTNTRFIFQTIIYTASAIKQKTFDFSVYSSRSERHHTKNTLHFSIHSSRSERHHRKTRLIFFNPLFSQRAPP